MPNPPPPASRDIECPKCGHPAPFTDERRLTSTTPIYCYTECGWAGTLSQALGHAPLEGEEPRQWIERLLVKYGWIDKGHHWLGETKTGTGFWLNPAWITVKPCSDSYRIEIGTCVDDGLSLDLDCPDNYPLLAEAIKWYGSQERSAL